MLNKRFLNKIKNNIPRLKRRAKYTYIKDEIVIMCLILNTAFPFLLHDGLIYMLTKYVPNLIPLRQMPN